MTDAPPIQYARTEDGVSIAYWRIGEGPALVHGPLMPYSHIEMEWRNPDIRRWYERLARGASLVRYDGRGNGLSQRDVADHSLEGHVRDLEAVIEQLGPEPVSLMGVFHSGPAAITYTARHPERVSRLVLWCTYANGGDYWRGAQAEGLRKLRQTDYRLFLRTAAHELLAWPDGEQADRFAEIMRDASTPEEADRLIAATREFNVGSALSKVSCPTLVVHRRDMEWLDISLSRDLASTLLEGSLTVVDGSSPLPAAGEIETPARALDAFLGRDALPPVAEVTARALQTILFTDLAGSTAMQSRLGDEAARDVLRAHDAAVRQAIEEFHGREV